MPSHIAHYCYHPEHGYVLFPSKGSPRDGRGRATFAWSPLQATGFPEQEVAVARLGSHEWYVKHDGTRSRTTLSKDIEVHAIRVSWDRVAKPDPRSVAREIVEQMSDEDRATFTCEAWRDGVSAMLQGEWAGLDLDIVLDQVGEAAHAWQAWAPLTQKEPGGT